LPPNTCHPLPAFCPLPACCLLSAAHCLLLPAVCSGCLLPTVCCPLPAAHCLLPTVFPFAYLPRSYDTYFHPPTENDIVCPEGLEKVASGTRFACRIICASNTFDSSGGCTTVSEAGSDSAGEDTTNTVTNTNTLQLAPIIGGAGGGGGALILIGVIAFFWYKRKVRYAPLSVSVKPI
jgi:hypothetical protein